MSARRDARSRSSSIGMTTVPVELRAGACQEVWAPGDPWKARRRWREARAAWLAAHGVPLYYHDAIPAALRRGARMWSYEYLRTEDPDRLASALEFRELPPDWKPRLVDSYDYGPPLIDPHMPWDEFRRWRDARGAETQPSRSTP